MLWQTIMVVKLSCGGGHSTSENISQLLRNLHNIDAHCFIDNDLMKVDNCRVFSKEYFKGKSQDYYIVVPIGYYKSVSDSLKEMGYIPEKDYCYFCDCIVREEKNYYEDRHGNIIKGSRSGIKVPLCCYNACMEIGQDVTAKNCCFTVANSANVKIESNVNISDCNIEVGENAYLEIGRNSNISLGGRLVVQAFAQLVIGEGCSFAQNIDVRAHHFSKISIGMDCMFSYQVIILAGDGHSIFDVVSGENQNSLKNKYGNLEVNIGDHVWMGARSTVLGKTEIGNGSVVGAACLVKGSFPNNCILAGNPARIIKRDIAWCREDCAEDILQCGTKNINLTKG